MTLNSRTGILRTSTKRKPPIFGKSHIGLDTLPISVFEVYLRSMMLQLFVRNRDSHCPPAEAGDQVAAAKRNHEKGAESCFIEVGSLRTSEIMGFPELPEDPESRSPNSGLQNSYCVDYRTLRWIYFWIRPGSGLEAPVTLQEI